MMTVMPIFFAFTGVQFQIGVLVYWVTTNLWTMGQQFFTIRNMPAPGSEAETKYRARVNAKRARQGKPSLEEEEAAQRQAELEAAGKTGGQRVQPVRKDRQKKQRTGLPATVEEQYAEERSEEEKAVEEIETTAGLTPEEIARRRYEKRARQRAQRNLEDTEFLTREIAALRLAMNDVATRDFVRSELRDMLSEILAEERLTREEIAEFQDSGDDEPDTAPEQRTAQ